jgi:hypothetical protein
LPRALGSRIPATTNTAGAGERDRERLIYPVKIAAAAAVAVAAAASSSHAGTFGTDIAALDVMLLVLVVHARETREQIWIDNL